MIRAGAGTHNARNRDGVEGRDVGICKGGFCERDDCYYLPQIPLTILRLL